MNPYLEELKTWPRDEIMWEYYQRWQPAMLSVPYAQLAEVPHEMIKERKDLCNQYAWSIPDSASLEFVAKHLGRNAVEIGAGTGYYASLLAKLGTWVICYDCDPPQRSTQNHWCSPRTEHELLGQLRPVYQEVYYGGPGKASKYTFPLFLCWPPMSDMAYKALRCYAGNTLVYIGEGNGGCTADEDFFSLLERAWEQIDEHRPIQWSGIHDWITVYERRKQ